MVSWWALVLVWENLACVLQDDDDAEEEERREAELKMKLMADAKHEEGFALNGVSFVFIYEYICSLRFVGHKWH